MTDADLTDDDIAFLCDIGEFNVERAAEVKRDRLERLLGAGYIEPASEQQKPAKYQLTEKAMRFLDARGVGLNEA